MSKKSSAEVASTMPVEEAELKKDVAGIPYSFGNRSRRRWVRFNQGASISREEIARRLIVEKLYAPLTKPDKKRRATRKAA